MARLFYIDNLRGVLTMLVVWHHSALAVSGLGRWYYCMTRGHEEAVSFAVLATLLFTSEAFLTSLLFTIAGLLVPKSLQAKGVYKYLLRRIWRLGLPVLCVGLPIHHLCKWLGTIDLKSCTTHQVQHSPRMNIETMDWDWDCLEMLGERICVPG